MNRAQRRATARSGAAGPLHDIDTAIRAQSAALLEHARDIRRSVPYPGETLAGSLALVDEAIASLSVAANALVAGPALEELRGLRDELATRVRAN